MNKFFIKKLSIISFIFIPIIFLWHPSWLGFLGFSHIGRYFGYCLGQ